MSENNKAVATIEKSIADSVLTRVNQLTEIGELVLPPNYIPANALKAAWLAINEVESRDKKPALEVCTKNSIANALYEMVVNGYSVVKKQCYFVVYGNELKMEDSYIGKIVKAKRDAHVKEVNAVTVYKNDIFEYEINTLNGRKKVVKHEQKLENIDITKIAGAYAIVTYEDGSTDTEIMTLAQIQKAWEQGGSKGSSPAHKNFADQMAEKTVISRALKIPADATDDAALMKDALAVNVDHEIKEKANKTEIGMEDDVQEAEEVKDGEPEKEQQPEESNEKKGPGF